MIDYLTLIDNGVLAIIAGWFMFRMEKVIKNNTEVLYQVKGVISNGKIKRRKN